MPSTLMTINSDAVFDTAMNSAPSVAPLILHSKKSFANTESITKQSKMLTTVELNSKNAAYATA